MNNLYDNGTCLLGTKKDIYDYILNDERLESWEYEDLLNDLKEHSDDTIICVNYDNGMGYSYDYWETTDIIKEVI